MNPLCRKYRSRQWRSTLLRHFLLLLAAAVLNGCSMAPVKPWQRDVLAKDKMQLIPDAVEEYFDTHIYYSREGAFGSKGVGGGGCGCN